MKTTKITLALFLGSLLAISTFSCKKEKNKIEPEPVVPAQALLSEISTSTINFITQTTAQCGGNITSDGGASVTKEEFVGV